MEPKKKILKVGLITNSYLPNLNGVSITLSNLEKSLRDKGVEVFIVTPKIPGVVYPDYILPLPSVPAPSYTSKDLRIPISFNKAVKFFQNNNVQILHSHDTFVGGVDTVFIAKKLGIPCLHTYHTLVEEYDYFKIIGYKQFIRTYSQIVCDNYDGVIGLSSKISKYLSELNVTKPIYNLPNIYIPAQSQKVSIRSNRSNPTTQKELLKFDKFIETNGLNKSFNIITWGRVAKEKNLLESINTVLPLLRLYPDMKYIIAGDGPYRQILQNKIAELHLERQVFLYGAYKPIELNQLASMAKIFLVTSYSEVLPTTPLEAMNYGLPVVAVNDLAFEYIVQDGINGFWRPFDRLTKVLNDLYHNPEELKKLSINAKSSYLNYLEHDYTQDYIDLYQNLIQQKEAQQKPTS